jgi:small subunit ribosomal protein S4
MFKAKEKKERALGTKLFIKPERCNSPKCVMIRRPARPGVHGKRRRTLSEFGNQLQEKQKIRFTYGIGEKQMANIFKEAVKNPGVTGEVVIQLLERRLDNTVYRLGLAASRSVARQVVGHGHIFVNGRRTTVPSYRVRSDDIITIRPESRNHSLFKDVQERLKQYDAPVWLRLDLEKVEGHVIGLPKDFEIPFDVGLVVDYYSK